MGFDQLRLSGSQTLSGDSRWITTLRIAKDRSGGIELEFVPHATVRADVCVATVSVAIVRASFTTTTTHDIDCPKYHPWSNRLQTSHGVQEPFHLVTLLFSHAATHLQAVSRALVRERQVLAWAKELADKIASLQKQRQTAERELASLQEILDADPEVTVIARRMMQKAGAAAGGRSAGVAIPNPKYVTADAKRELLTKILHDHRQENPEA